LAQGPEEKYGRAGRTAGGVFVTITLLAESTRRVGTAWPAAGSSEEFRAAKPARKRFGDEMTNRGGFPPFVGNFALKS